MPRSRRCWRRLQPRTDRPLSCHRLRPARAVEARAGRSLFCAGASEMGRCRVSDGPASAIMRGATDKMPNERHSWRHSLPLALLLLWLAGIGLRLTILAVPPVLAIIRDDFGLSATEVGLLSSIPPALFAIA